MALIDVQETKCVGTNSPTLTYQFDAHLLQAVFYTLSDRVGEWAQSSDDIVWTH